MEGENNKQRISIGYFRPFILGDSNISLIKGIHEKAKQLDVNLICIMGQRLNDIFGEFTQQANMIYGLVDKEYINGVVVWYSQINMGISEQDTQEFYDKLKNIPIIGVCEPIKGCCNIASDDKAGITAIMEHFIKDHNYTKIGFICGDKSHNSTTIRLNAYKESLKDFGLQYNPQLVSDYCDFSIEAGKKATRQLFEQRNLQPDEDIQAIVVSSDTIAIGVCEELRRLGISCPDEIAIAGFNNRDETRICKPALTTINPSFIEQGDKAVDLLVNTVKNKVKCESINIPGRLIIRNSCGCKELNLSDIKINNKLIKITEEQIKETIKNIKRKIIPFYYSIDSSWVENMVSSIIYDIENNTERFLSILDVYLDIICSHNEDVSNFQSIITVIRNEIFQLISDRKTLLKLSDICNKARITITNVTEVVTMNKSIRNDTTLFSIYFTEQKFMTTFTLKEFLDTVETILKQIDIEGCYISIYENKEDVLKKAKLIFGYSEKERIRIANDYYFNPKEIVPKEFRPKNRRYVYLVNALYYKDMQIGFVVYETDLIDKLMFDTLSSQISNMLYKIEIFEHIKKIDNEKQILMKKLEDQNSQLEEMIQQRTYDIKVVNDQLQETIFKTNLANQAKTKFLANMSHEIRTPLNCIIGFSEILNNMDYKTEEYNKYSLLIANEADKLLSLINGILDISKIESGKTLLNTSVFDIHNCIETITSTHSTIAQNKGLYYHIYGLDILPRLLKGDSTKLKQVLTNILSNAIKFTNSGGVTLSLEIAEETETEIKILFNINDTGIGIPKDKQKAIFEDFVRVNTNDYEGTGLGIPISKHLVEIMHGNIGVDSIEGEGSTFWFTVKFVKVEQTFIEDLNEKKSNNISIERLKDCTIMLVEDYALNRELAKIYLSKMGCKIIEAINGKKAIEGFIHNDIDLILIDIQMDEMDGCEAVSIIRSIEKGKNIPIIAITANVFEADIKHYLSIGMDDVITKPFKKEDFQYKVILWLNKVNNINNHNENKYIKDTEEISNKEQFIDIAKNLRELDGDIDFFVSITTELLDNAKSQLPIIYEAVKNKDYDLIMKQAHTIRGGALNLSAKPLSDILQIIEDKGRNNDLTKINEAINELDTIIIKTETYLKTQLS